jgi:hypothetical protein
MEREKVNNFFVYGLVDPRDNQIKYIGKTTNLLKKRFYHHISESLKSKKPNKKQASKFFNVSRDTIYYNINKKLKGYNIWVKA